MTINQALKGFFSLEKKPDIITVHTTRVEQALLLQLLMQNSKHLSSKFVPPADIDDRYSRSFFLPMAWLSMQDIGRLNKTIGCVVCGEPTRSQCGGCSSTQYCSKGFSLSQSTPLHAHFTNFAFTECQKKHWPDHKFLCRTISSGTWHTTVLEPNPMAAFTGLTATFINRFDDLDEHSPVADARAREKVPPNIYGDSYHIVKLQLPLTTSEPSHMLVYDKSKSFQLFFRADKNLEAFIEAVEAMGSWPKLYRWAQRVGDWEWKICFDREPQPAPRW